MAAHAPSFRYHPTIAPEGKLFETHEELDALPKSWVETPAKFAKAQPVPEPPSDPVIDALEPLRKRRKGAQ